MDALAVNEDVQLVDQHQGHLEVSYVKHFVSVHHLEPRILSTLSKELLYAVKTHVHVLALLNLVLDLATDFEVVLEEVVDDGQVLELLEFEAQVGEDNEPNVVPPEVLLVEWMDQLEAVKRVLLLACDVVIHRCLRHVVSELAVHLLLQELECCLLEENGDVVVNLWNLLPDFDVAVGSLFRQLEQLVELSNHEAVFDEQIRFVRLQIEVIALSDSLVEGVNVEVLRINHVIDDGAQEGELLATSCEP